MSLRPAGGGWLDDHSSQTSEWIRRETRPLSSRCNDHSSQPRDPLRTGTWISLRIRPLPEGVTVDCVAVAQEVGRCGIVGEGVHDLLGGPVGGGMLGHVEMDDPSAVVSEYNENE